MRRGAHPHWYQPMNLATRSIFLVLCLAIPAGAFAQDPDLTQLALEDLLNVEVTSVSRKEQPLSRTAAAVHVINEEDITRSGARTVADLLHMVPGFHVSEMDANSWAVGSRGFSAFYASKLLVLIDGRTVYTPLFAGVHWEMLNLPLQDIERIEVIRGPGGSVWGANAVNGVVNIITKKADDTRGAFVRMVTGGSHDVDGYARYGAALSDRVDFRVFGRGLRRESGDFNGVASPDRGDIQIGGGRVDWQRSDIETLSINAATQRGELRRLRQGAVLRLDDNTFEGSNVVVSWTRSPSSKSESAVQFYYDTYNQGASNGSWAADLDARHRRSLGRRHEVVVGAGFRVWENHARDFVPERDRVRLFQVFLQDEIELASGVYLTAGSRVEHNDYTGFEIQPSLRVLWQPTGSQAVWAAGSRAVRTPSAGSRGVRASFDAPTPRGDVARAELVGNPDIGSERLKAFETGYRVQFGNASVDVAAFRNVYLGLQSAEPSFVLPSAPGTPSLRFTLDNGLQGNTYGAEVAGKWNPWRRLRLAGAYTRLAIDIVNAPGSVDAISLTLMNSSSPNDQVHGRAYLDLPGRVEASAFVWRVGRIEGLGVDAYTRLDLHTTWAATRHLELGIGAQNLLRGDGVEFIDINGTLPLPRTPRAFGEVTWRF
jgi:iron complex outermembrane recepter protein